MSFVCLFVSFFALGMSKDFHQKAQCIESRFLIGPENIVFAGVSFKTTTKSTKFEIHEPFVCFFAFASFFVKGF